MSKAPFSGAQCCAVPEHWHRLPRGCGVSSLGMLRSCLAMGLGSLLWVSLLEQGWARGAQSVLPASAVLGFWDSFWLDFRLMLS